jgi:hypothetical protein
MNSNIRNLDLELSLIIARIYKHLKIKSGISIDIIGKNFSNSDMLFFPQLILLASYGPKGINKKTRTLAVVSQIMYLSTEIHNQIPEKTKVSNFKSKVQLPILVGDLLYSRFYEILCIEDCIEFFDDFIEYISQLNLNWINYLNNEISLEDICASWYGELAGIVMELAAKTSGLNGYWLKVIKRYGYGIGNLFGASKLGLEVNAVNTYLDIVNEAINLMPPGELKDTFSVHAHNLSKNLFTDVIQDQFEFSAVAES